MNAPPQMVHRSTNILRISRSNAKKGNSDIVAEAFQIDYIEKGQNVYARSIAEATFERVRNLGGAI